jgi:hypothetical protein
MKTRRRTNTITCTHCNDTLKVAVATETIDCPWHPTAAKHYKAPLTELAAIYPLHAVIATSLALWLPTVAWWWLR